jgi:hypothetical protein
MHFIAMLGFTIPGQVITYNVPVTIGSMLIAVAVVGIGLFIVGVGGRGPGPPAARGHDHRDRRREHALRGHVGPAHARHDEL